MPLNNNTTTLLLQALKGITGNPDQCFTTYDVTKAICSLTDKKVRHPDVRDVIHALYEQGFLNRYQRESHRLFFLSKDDYRTVQLFVPLTGDSFAYDPDEVQNTRSQDSEPIAGAVPGNNLQGVPNLPPIDPPQLRGVSAFVRVASDGRFSQKPSNSIDTPQYSPAAETPKRLRKRDIPFHIFKKIISKIKLPKIKLPKFWKKTNE